MSQLIESILQVELTKINESHFKHRYASSIVLTQDHKILLQQRGSDWVRFPGALSTFGGRVEIGESPMQALIRELHEELGARVKESDVVSLGAITEAITNHCELVYVYFWQDKLGTITGCYEGEARYYDNVEAALKHPHVMDYVRWLLRARRDLIEKR
jgi:8-oxo-dGTP diphosphatase